MINLLFWRQELIPRGFNEELFNYMEKDYLNGLFRKRTAKGKRDHKSNTEGKNDRNAPEFTNRKRRGKGDIKRIDPP